MQHFSFNSDGSSPKRCLNPPTKFAAHPENYYKFVLARVAMAARCTRNILCSVCSIGTAVVGSADVL